MLRRASLIIALAFFAVPPATVSAAQEGTGAGAFVQNLADTAIGVLRESDGDAARREQRFRELLRDGFDLPAIGRFVLGRYWTQATPEQRTAYLATFADYVVYTYTAQLGNYAGETFRVVSERDAGEGEMIVQSRIEMPGGGQSIAADWRVRESDGRYRVVDVTIEGVSMAVTQRSDFGSVVRSNGLDGLIEAMRSRLPRPSTG